MLAGRAAEKIMIGSVSSGAADDLEQATRLARIMVTQWGMSNLVGPIHFKTGTEHPFLGYELTQEKDYSEETAAKIDQEVRRIIEEAEQKATTTLEAHRPLLAILIENLVEKETLTREDIDVLMKEATPGTGAAEAG